MKYNKSNISKILAGLISAFLTTTPVGIRANVNQDVSRKYICSLMKKFNLNDKSMDDLMSLLAKLAGFRAGYTDAINQNNHEAKMLSCKKLSGNEVNDEILDTVTHDLLDKNHEILSKLPNTSSPENLKSNKILSIFLKNKTQKGKNNNEIKYDNIAHTTTNLCQAIEDILTEKFPGWEEQLSKDISEFNKSNK